MPECYIRGSTIKYLRIPDEIIDMVKEEVHRPRGDGRGRGRGGGRGGGRGKCSCSIHCRLKLLATGPLSVGTVDMVGISLAGGWSER